MSVASFSFCQSLRIHRTILCRTAISFFDVMVSPFMFLIFGMSSPLHGLDVRYALRTFEFFECFLYLFLSFVSFLVTDTFFDLFAHLTNLPFVFFFDRFPFAYEGQNLFVLAAAAAATLSLLSLVSFVFAAAASFFVLFASSATASSASLISFSKS